MGIRTQRTIFRIAPLLIVIILSTLKLFKTINWSWWIVFLPMLLVFIFSLIAFFKAFIKHVKRIKSEKSIN